jgi:rubrerythrin
VRARIAPFLQAIGERFEDSEGKQIFLEFAEEERAHLELLIREYKALVKRQGRTRGRAAAAKPSRASGGASRRAAAR